jgi:hypothetical protein
MHSGGRVLWGCSAPLTILPQSPQLCQNGSLSAPSSTDQRTYLQWAQIHCGTMKNSVHSYVHTLKGARDLGARGIGARGLSACVWGQEEELKSLKEILKIGFSWMKGTDKGGNYCSDFFYLFFISTTCIIKFSIYLFWIFFGLWGCLLLH